MSLDRVAFHQRGMAAAKRLWNAVAAAINARVFNGDRLHTEAVGAQMVNPRAAATSRRFEIDFHGRRLRREAESWGCRGYERRREGSSGHHAITSRSR
jgi:hypothetical protein